MRRFGIFLLASSALSAGSPALAQVEPSGGVESADENVVALTSPDGVEASQDNTVEPADEDAGEAVGEIIVTAQKRSQNLQDVPVAISALNSEMLEQRGINTTDDLQFAVPSMQVGKLIGATSITIRGVGLNQGSPGVAIHLDGVYQTRPSMGDLLQIDLDRVEVLRGPQGTLYGRNANGGVVNFITKAPTDDYEGYVLASYASYNETRLQGMVNVPFSDSARGRLVLDWNKRRDGFVKNVIPGGQDVDKGETISGRLRFAFDLAPNLKLDLSTNFLDGSGPTQYFVLHNQPVPLAVALNPSLATATYSFKPWRTTANDPIDTDRNFITSAATLTWDIGDFTVKSISGYTKLRDNSVADDDGINVSIFPAKRFFETKSFSQELNVGASFDAADVVAGLYYLSDDLRHKLDYNLLSGIAVTTPQGPPPGSQLLFEIPEYDTRVKAVFADVTVRPLERLSLIAGVRYSDEKQSQTQRNSIRIGANGPRIFTCPLRTNDVKFTSTTPRFGARYELSDDVNAYATYSKGFKSGGFNLFACNDAFKPEKLTSYEGGIKTRLFDRALTLNLSGFYYDYTDLQISQVVGLARTISNAAAAEVTGAELEAAWRPDDHWTVDANLSWLDATYKRFSNVDGLAPQLGPQVLDGNRLNRSPKLSTNVGVGYRTTPGESGTFSFRTDVSQRSKQFYREFNGPLDSQKGFALINASVTWDSTDERFRVRLFGTNLTNKAYIGQMDSSDTFGARFITWGAPRQYGVELRANF